MSFVIHHGDALTVLRTMPADSLDCCITSPPYFGLRDYQVAGQLGLERTPEAFVAALADVFDDVRRVLKPAGTLWLNLGDSYCANATGWVGQNPLIGAAQDEAAKRPNKTGPGLKPKDLIGIPWSVAFELRKRGWYLRSDIIWHKPNPMPESVTDRPTKAHEYIFMLAKSAKYYYDADSIREAQRVDQADPRRERNSEDFRGRAIRNNDMERLGTTRGKTNESCTHPNGRNKRTVWTLATMATPDAHFATYPLELPETCLLAGTSERGCCPECGAPWKREKERSGEQKQAAWSGAGRANGCMAGGGHVGRTGQWSATSATTGWTPTCNHTAEPVPCTVLDPFCGAGTTGLAALKNGRRFVGIELKAEYIAMAHKRAMRHYPLLISAGCQQEAADAIA